MPKIGIPKRQHDSVRSASKGRPVRQTDLERQSRSGTKQSFVASDTLSKAPIDEPSRICFNNGNQSKSRSGFTHDIFQLTAKLKKPIAIVALGVLRIPLLATPVQSPMVDAEMDFGIVPSGWSAYEEPSTELVNKNHHESKPEVLVPSSPARPNVPEAKKSGENLGELVQPLATDDLEPLVMPAFPERSSSVNFELRTNGRFSFVDPALNSPSN